MEFWEVQGQCNLCLFHFNIVKLINTFNFLLLIHEVSKIRLNVYLSIQAKDIESSSSLCH